jgi:colanic acid/amylovoran biosynthesis glycosyltransferase
LQKSILIITSTFPVYSETFIVDHVKGMLDRGWLVSVATNRINRNLLELFFPDKPLALVLHDFSPLSSQKLEVIFHALLKAFNHVDGHPHPGSFIARWMAVKAHVLSELIDELKPDVVHAHFGPNGVLAAMALKNKRIPLIVNFHGYDVTSYVKSNGWGLYENFFSKAILIAHSQFVSNKVAIGLRRQCENVVMGVDSRKFLPRKKDNQEWPKPLRFLSVGRLTQCKGHNVAIDAVKLLNNRYPEWSVELSIVGGGEEESNLIKKIKIERLSAFVKCRGVLDSSQVSVLMQEADVLLVCSQSISNGWEEAFCRVAVEGMACGMAVVVTPCGGLPDTVEGAGYVAKGCDVESVVETIESLISLETPSLVAKRAVKKSAQYDLVQMIDDYSAVSTRVMLLP